MTCLSATWLRFLEVENDAPPQTHACPNVTKCIKITRKTSDMSWGQ